ncbi:isochorismate synthase [Shewanella sp. AS16]|uniref:isochorismate synthase n=1 Tax=Shewanella sp. AS16 TaxID=2907625 RepID=UPI001F00A1C5|nr:isochorismate synthase [Shewanella sp. AS16]MCE9687294.1 isochorismate synthase [Shewanella sp. AS16]
MDLYRTSTDKSQPAQADKQASLFSSAHKRIHATGVFTRVAEPALGGGMGNGVFQHAIKAAFSRARQAGITAPIIMGAVPFDVTQVSNLYIPQSYEFIEATAPFPGGRASGSQPVALKQMQSQPNEQRFKQGVAQAVANFNLSDIKKAVLSRILELEFSAGVDVDTLLANLISQNPNGYHFRIPMADGGELLGVSPELLIRKQGERIFSNPLAGSAKRQTDAAEDLIVGQNLKKSSKDSYEHSLVIEAIRHILTPVCRRLDIPAGPELISTAAMWHLSTKIAAQLRDPCMSALQLACLLHPTPAVCGSPAGEAHKLIKLVEAFDRGLFSGMVGWCNEAGDGEWAVTIRCATVKDRRVRLFAGAGIVKESCPESEWLETQAKLGTMLNALGVRQLVEA